MNKIKKIGILVACCLVLTGCGENVYEQGVKQLESENYEAAVTSFEKAVEKEKNLADSYRGLGIAYWELQEYENAKDALEKSIEHGTEETATIYSILGNCELELQNAEEAVAYYEKVLSAENVDESLRQDVEFNVIVAYEQMKDLDTAREKLEEYLGKYPEDEAAAKEAEFLETR